MIASGTKLDRPELGRLLMDSHHNDILLVEQIDRLTRLSNSDWMTLKQQIEQHELRIVSLDVPTSWQALSDKDPSQADPITRSVITAINNMLIDLMAAMSHKDWLSRRQRQKQGIERAHTLGKYRGKQANQERHHKVLYYRQIKKLSIRETAMQRGTALHRFAGYKRFTKKMNLPENFIFCWMADYVAPLRQRELQ